MNTKTMVRELLRSVGLERKAKVDPLFKAAVGRLGEGDIALDFGANIGVYTEMLALTGATVHAYEPDPVAFEMLCKRLKDRANVTFHNSAVSSRSGEAQLFRHVAFGNDPVIASQSSSLLNNKHNVDSDSYVAIKGVDIVEVLEAFPRVALMKMDIEGAEVEVLNRILDAGLADRISTAFVEVHDRKEPQLGPATTALKQRFIDHGLSQYRFDWH